jgi:hypothetical protein
VTERHETFDGVRVEEVEDDKEFYRLVQFPDGNYEILKAELGYEDDGDAESGPSLSSFLKGWEVVEAGMGFPDLRQGIKRLKEEGVA